MGLYFSSGHCHVKCGCKWLCTLHLSEPLLAGSQPRVDAPNIKILKIHNAVGRLRNICFFDRLAKYIQIQSPWFECRSANLIQFKDNFGNYQWPIPLTENKNVKKGSIVKGHVYQFYHTLTHTKHHILDIQPESSGLCCFSLTLRPGTRENSGELDKYLTARDYSCGFLHIDVVDNVGRCWKMLEDWSETREN